MIKCWNFFQEKNYSKTGFTRRLNWYDSSIYIKTRIIKFWLSRSNSFMDSITTHCYARWNAKIIKFWFKFLRRKIDTIHTQLAIIIIIVRDKTRYDNNKILTNCSNLNLNSKKKLFFEKIDKIFRRVIITRSKINIARGKNWQRFTHRCLLDFVDSIERAFITIRMMQKKEWRE